MLIEAPYGSAGGLESVPDGAPPAGYFQVATSPKPALMHQRLPPMTDLPILLLTGVFFLPLTKGTTTST